MARRHPAVRAAATAFAAFGLIGALLVLLVKQPGASATDLRATPGTTWLSGEAQGQVVLAAAGGELASVSVAVGDANDQLDVVDLGSSVFVHNRTQGQLLRLAGVNGDVKDRWGAPKSQGPAALVRAGTSVYLVDQDNKTAQRVNQDGNHTDPVTLDAFTSWVGTDDGRLWLVDAPTGSVISFDGKASHTTRVLQLGQDSTLTAVASDPVIVDRTNGRLRWLRRGVTFDPGFSLNGSLVQQPSLRGSCLQLIVDNTLRCFSSRRQDKSLPLVGGTSAGDQLFVNERNALVTSPKSTRVLLGSWRTKTWNATQRPAPSSRQPIAWANPGPLLVDDPGSRYALTADDARLVLLDKASRLTIVSEGGEENSGIGVAASAKTDGSETQVLDTQINRNLAKSNGGPNLAPLPQPDRVTTRSGRSVAIAVLANDVDPNGDILAVSGAGPVPSAQGKVIVSNGQVLNYSPPDTFVGQVTFPYEVTDPGNLKATSTVTVDVLGGDRNSPPKLADDTAKTVMGAGVTVDVLANDHDDEGDPLTITETSTPAHGALSLRPEGIRYEPAPGYAGPDEFTYTAIDGYGGKATASVRITVTAPPATNRPPQAVDDRGATRAGKHVVMSVLANDSDPDGDTLRVTDVSEAPGLTISIVDGQAIDVLPANNVSGPVSFTYTIADTGGLTSRATVILLVDSVAENRPPSAVDDRATSTSNAITIDVTGNDYDPDGDLISITAFTQPAAGVVTKFSTTALRFTPAPGTTGTQTFTYTIADTSNLTSTAKVTVEVIAPTRSGPVARDDFATVFPGDKVVIKPLANDSHPDGLGFSLSGTPVGRGADIQVVGDTLTFTPPDASLTSYVFTYTIQDTAGKTATAQITISVVAKPVTNRAPIAKDDRVDAKFGESVTIPVLANDTDPDNDKLTIVEIADVSSGSAASTGGSIVFTPPAQFSGLASFSYTVADPGGLKSTARVVVQVADRPKSAPIANADAVVSVGGERVTISPMDNDVDPDGTTSALVLSKLTSPTSAVEAVINSDGRQVQIKPPTTNGIYTVNYTITDPDGLSAVGTITVTVQSPPNKPPVAVNDNVTLSFGGNVTIAVLSNDTDPDGGKLTITAVTDPTSGTAVASGGSILYTAAAGFSGKTSFTYTISDPQGATSTATVSVTVDACAAPTPVLVNDSAYTKLNTPVLIDLFANDTNTAGTTFTVIPPTSGTVTVAGPGRVTFSPATNSPAAGSFAYSVTTVCGAVATASVSVTVDRPPTAVDDKDKVTSGQTISIDVLANDSDPDNDPLTIVSVGAVVGGGTATTNGAKVTFTADAGTKGPSTFTYTIADPGGLTSTAKVTVQVTPVNHAPVAASYTARTTAGQSVTIDIMINNKDVDGDPLTIATVSAASPSNAGPVTFSGGSTASYSPPITFSGTATFSFVVSDGSLSDTGTVTVTVDPFIPPNSPPVAVNDAFVTSPAGLLTWQTGNVLANDTDPDPLDVLTITGVTVSGAATATWAGGIITVTVAALGPQDITINYTISDGHGHTASATAGITFA